MRDVPIQIEPEDLASMRQAGADVAVLDVREPWEVQICLIPGSLAVPLGRLPEALAQLPSDRPLVVVCHHGARSMQAVAWLRGNGFDNATNLRGGIDAWARRIEPTMATY